MSMLRSQRQKCHKLIETHPGYIVRPCLKKHIHKKTFEEYFSRDLKNTDWNYTNTLVASHLFSISKVLLVFKNHHNGHILLLQSKTYILFRKKISYVFLTHPQCCMSFLLSGMFANTSVTMWLFLHSSQASWHPQSNSGSSVRCAECLPVPLMTSSVLPPEYLTLAEASSGGQGCAYLIPSTKYTLMSLFHLLRDFFKSQVGVISLLS